MSGVKSAILVSGALLCFSPPAQAAQPAPHRYARIVLTGDLDSRRTTDLFLDTLRRLDSLLPGVILIELNGNRARDDLLFEAIGAVRRTQTPLAVSLDDPADRTVGPGQLAFALSAAHASISPRVRIERDPGDVLESLNPDIEDWSIVRLDLRHAVEPVAERRGFPASWIESLVAPRAAMRLVEDGEGRLRLEEADADTGATPAPVITRDERGWTCSLDARDAARLYGIALNRTTRPFLRSLGLRGRPIETVTIDSGLIGAHERCRLLVRQIRVAIGLADAALDVRHARRGGASLLPRDYHAAADKAGGYIAECRSAIAEIDRLTTAYPEVLSMEPPPDAETPTEIGGPTRPRPEAWRDAVRDAERRLASLDRRVAGYRRR